MKEEEKKEEQEKKKHCEDECEDDGKEEDGGDRKERINLGCVTCAAPSRRAAFLAT